MVDELTELVVKIQAFASRSFVFRGRDFSGLLLAKHIGGRQTFSHVQVARCSGEAALEVSEDTFPRTSCWCTLFNPRCLLGTKVIIKPKASGLSFCRKSSKMN